MPELAVFLDAIVRGGRLGAIQKTVAGAIARSSGRLGRAAFARRNAYFAPTLSRPTTETIGPIGVNSSSRLSSGA